METAVFSCWSIKFNRADKILIWWYKDGKMLTHDNKSFMQYQFLFIENLQLSDQGLYSCKISFKGTTLEKKSENVWLNVTAG